MDALEAGAIYHYIARTPFCPTHADRSLPGQHTGPQSLREPGGRCVFLAGEGGYRSVRRSTVFSSVVEAPESSVRMSWTRTAWAVGRP